MKIQTHSAIGGCLFLAAIVADCLAAPVPPPTEPKLRCTLEGHNDCVHWVAFSPDGKTLASVSRNYTVMLWDVGTGKETATLKGHTGAVFGIAFSPDGKTVASGSDDGTIKLWDVATAKETAALQVPRDFVRSLAYSADGKTLASGTFGGKVTLWDVESKKERSTVKLESFSYLSGFAFRPDGKVLAIANFTVWDATGKKIITLEESPKYPECQAFASEGKMVAIGCASETPGVLDGTVRLWDVATGKQTASYKHPPTQITCVAFSPNGKLLGSGYKDPDHI